MRGPLARLGAHVIRATSTVDSAYRRFDALRSALVARFAPDSVLDAFNDMTYGASDVYRPDAANYRSELFNWEVDAIGRLFPPPPARILVGGAGGGREAFALAARGYEVVAFDPSAPLVRSMAAHAGPGGRVTPLLGRYEDLPMLLTPAAAPAERISLHDVAMFDAALFGWTSYSHIRRREARVVALRQIGAVTSGPIVASFYLDRAAGSPAQTRLGRLARRAGLGTGQDRFTTHVGFYHLSSPVELRSEARDAGLALVCECYDDSDGRWPYVAFKRLDTRRSD